MSKKNAIEILRASGALAAATTEYGTSYEDLRTSGVATATTADKLTASAGAFVVNEVSVGDIVKNVTTGKYALVTAIDSATALSLSADIFSDEDEYEIYTNHGLKLDNVYEEVLAVLDVTEAATDAGDTLDVFLDTSFDGGLSWFNIGHFTQVLGDGGAKKLLMSFKPNPVASSNCVVATSDQNAGNALQVGFGERFRYRATMVDADADGEFTFSLILIGNKAYR